jgi:hypothetical protein
MMKAGLISLKNNGMPTYWLSQYGCGEGDRAHSEPRNEEDSGGGDIGVGEKVFRGMMI